jgi:hypothetical protein
MPLNSSQVKGIQHSLSPHKNWIPSATAGCFKTVFLVMLMNSLGWLLQDRISCHAVEFATGEGHPVFFVFLMKTGYRLQRRLLQDCISCHAVEKRHPVFIVFPMKTGYRSPRRIRRYVY